MVRALRAIAAHHPAREVVAVSHGDPIKAALCGFEGKPIASLHERRVRTGGLVTLDIDAGAARILEEWEPRRCRP
jgi:broad specificity phosphatase PhoE